MRVLYVLANYPQASESYIDAEIAYFRRNGVEIAVVSPIAGYGDGADVPIYRDTVGRAVEEFRPDLVHVHYLSTAVAFLGGVPTHLPVTVRAHSFDWDPQLALGLTASVKVRAIYAFPHFARQCPEADKLVPLPVAYDAALYDEPLDAPVVPHRVVRLAAGRRVKGLGDFLEVARRVGPEAEFVLAVCQVRGDEQYTGELARACAGVGVSLHVNLGRRDATKLIRTAGIYLDTSDPSGHPFGMPISIAEALASGAIVLARNCPAVAEYLGGCGLTYGSVEAAACLVSSAAKMDDLARRTASEMARERAWHFRSDVVLPLVLADWRRLVP